MTLQKLRVKTETILLDLYCRWDLPEFMCQFCPTVQILSVNVSIFTLVAIALDRWDLASALRPHPIAVQNMRFRGNIFLVFGGGGNVPFFSFHLIHPPWLYIAPEAHFVLCFWMPATPSQGFLGQGSLDNSIGQGRPGAAFSFGARTERATETQAFKI